MNIIQKTMGAARFSEKNKIKTPKGEQGTIWHFQNLHSMPLAVLRFTEHLTPFSHRHILSCFGNA